MNLRRKKIVISKGYEKLDSLYLEPDKLVPIIVFLLCYCISVLDNDISVLCSDQAMQSFYSTFLLISKYN